jgi:mannose-1-phosphate guanylyltransferase
VPALRFSLEALAKVGCEAVAVDVEHLSERIESAFGDSFREMAIHYSRTEGSGTWGAAEPLRDFFSGVDAILILDGNTICRWPLKKMVKRHLKQGADATLLLSTRASLEQHGGGVAVDKDGRILELRSSGLAVSEEKGVRRHVFMGAQVLDPSLLTRIPPQGDLVKQLYEPLLMNGGSMQVIRNSRDWHDLSTPVHYLLGAWNWAKGRYPMRLFRRRWVSKSGRVAKGARVRRSVVENGAKVETRARVEQSLILTGATVGEGCRVKQSIIAPEVVLPARTRVAGRLVTPLKAGRDPSSNDSVVGDLVYTPLGQ